MSEGIVAGYDGSPGSAEALRWAAREARLRETTLTVCLVWTPDHLAMPAEPELSGLARKHGEETLARGVRYAESMLGPGRVIAALVAGSAAHVLCERARAADMVVLGSRGHSELRGLQLGSVAWQVAGHAPGRVVVVRGEWRPANQTPGPVVAGVDGSPDAAAALVFAAEEAVLRDVPLVAVCALTDAPGRLGEGRQLEAEFGELLAGQSLARPSLPLVRRVVPGTPRSALLHAAAGAQLLVTGARGRGGLTGMRLGPTAEAMLHHAPCPVGVTRA